MIKFTKTRNIWILIKLYKTYIRPKVEYNTPVWCPSLTKNIKKIEKIQKDFTRFAFIRCKIPYEDYSDRLMKINLKTLEDRRKFHDLVFLYKTIQGTTGLEFKNFFHFCARSYNLRSTEMKINTNHFYKNSIWCNSFFNRSIKLWNSLPFEVKSSISLPIFKNKLSRVDFSK